MAYILGWKDILRPIRDGYRHLFPSPDTGPTPEEREKQRQMDRLKGFAYFDTFDQIDAWTEAEADPLQIANTPLLQRPTRGHVSQYFVNVRSSRTAPDSHLLSTVDIRSENNQQSNVLLCHDYAGNYHDYESTSSIGVDEESYVCEYLQFVETFVYFSHKLACVPPPSWTNLLHRNGVKALGTILVEPQTKDCDKLLRSLNVERVSGEGPHFPMAKKLAEIARHYHFDGWLVNIEKPFSQDGWNPRILELFLRQLRSELGPTGTLIWYDALTVDNKIAYQNALTAENALFSKACGALLTNYCWKERDARNSYIMALEHDLSPDNIYFGVDVWAQNKTKLTHPRVTYPETGGGGTNTGVAVSKLAEIGLAVGVFAPAWSFEHFPNHYSDLERTIWDGSPLPKGLACSCGDADARHPQNIEQPISRSARQYPAGSEKFFYTDFSRGFGRHNEQEMKRIYNDKAVHSQLGSQSVLPHLSSFSLRDDRVKSLSHRLNDEAGKTNLIIEVKNALSSMKEPTQMDDFQEWSTSETASLDTLRARRTEAIPDDRLVAGKYHLSLPLFNFDMRADGSLQIYIAFKHLLDTPASSVSFYLKLTNDLQFITLKASKAFQKVEAPIGEPGGYDRLQEIGVRYCSPQVGELTVPIIEIREIRIVPSFTLDTAIDLNIDDIHIDRKKQGDTTHWRLSWTYRDNDSAKQGLSDLPCSNITGPFSYFLIDIEGVSLERTYALEHVLPETLLEDLVGKDIKLAITGVGFDGRQLAYKELKVHI